MPSQPLYHSLLRQQHRDPGILQHKRQPFRRIAQIQRHIRRTSCPGSLTASLSLRCLCPTSRLMLHAFDCYVLYYSVPCISPASSSSDRVISNFVVPVSFPTALTCSPGNSIFSSGAFCSTNS